MRTIKKRRLKGVRFRADGIGGYRDISADQMQKDEFGYGYTPEPRLPEPKSQADCPKGTVFTPSYISGTPGELSAVLLPAKCKELDFGPRSQADCPEGTTFIVFGGGKDDYGMPRVGTAKCLKLKSCEQQYAEYLAWLQENGPRIKIKQQTKEEFISKCSGTAPSPNPAVPATQNVQSALQSLADKNWLLPAIAVGVGVYLITRKS